MRQIFYRHRKPSLVQAIILSFFTAVYGQPSRTAAAVTANSIGSDSSQSVLLKLSKAVAPTLATIKPPGNPTISNHYISEKDLAKLTQPKQSLELSKYLADLQTGSVAERVALLKNKTIKNMVYVQGGSFMRGDFASLMGIEGTSRMTSKDDDKVVKEITLSDFWISKYKTTYAEFDVFSDATGRQRNGLEFDGKLRHPDIPARAYWQETKDYCRWLGELTQLPIDLPSEAQWEYAARSRGQLFAISTDDGNVDYGRNLPYSAQAQIISPVRDPARYSVGLFPPNSLGLYDMSANGTEWVNDWYAEDAYSKSESLDPKGPSTGTRKTVRSRTTDSPLIGSTVHRYSEQPIPIRNNLDNKFVPWPTYGAPAGRCVVVR